MKRIFDFTLAFIGILLLFPLFLLLILLIVISSNGGAFYKQVRVGRFSSDFKLFKFRSMYLESDNLGLLTIGDDDKRITTLGKVMRKYKLDELPQLINVLKGDMSLVGPRPEVRKYVALYNDEQIKVLQVRPGITDMASIKYKDENNILSNYANPENAYINIIMPNKLAINLEYLKESQSVIGSLKVVILTLRVLFK